MSASGEKPLAYSHAIFLTGFMGAGKTTVGRLLAERLGWRFIDLDDEIVRNAGRSVAQIFDQSGEAEFRRQESGALEAILERLDSSSPMVVALGGGAVTNRANLSLLAASGHPTICLEAPVEELLARCRDSGQDRPLERDENQFRQLFLARRRAYMEADACLSTSQRTPEEVVAELLQLLGKQQP
jgi:shikimate kinase